MPWPLERALIGAAGRAPDGTIHRIAYTEGGNYVFCCGAVMWEVSVKPDSNSSGTFTITLSNVSHKAAMKLRTDEPIDCMLCLMAENEDP